MICFDYLTHSLAAIFKLGKFNTEHIMAYCSSYFLVNVLALCQKHEPYAVDTQSHKFKVGNILCFIFDLGYIQYFHHIHSGQAVVSSCGVCAVGVQ
jgi:hypothetical protein